MNYVCVTDPHLRCEHVNCGMLSHCGTGEQTVGSSTGTHKAMDPVAPTGCSSPCSQEKEW